jgi:hypothetical protein
MVWPPPRLTVTDQETLGKVEPRFQLRDPLLQLLDPVSILRRPQRFALEGVPLVSPFVAVPAGA